LVNSLNYRRLTHPTRKFYRGLDNDDFFLSLGILGENTSLSSQGDKMSNFEELKAGLKDKWLDFFEENQSWITQINEWKTEYNYGVKRPPAKLIIGIIAVLEPEINNYLIPLSTIDNSGDNVVNALGLNFNPHTELEKREEERAKIQEAEAIPLLPETNPHTEYLNQFRN
jgi:hypothetical protein